MIGMCSAQGKNLFVYSLWLGYCWGHGRTWGLIFSQAQKSCGLLYLLARAPWLQAWFWYHQDMFEEAESEALRALGIFEKLGATNDVEEIDGRSIQLFKWVSIDRFL